MVCKAAMPTASTLSVQGKRMHTFETSWSVMVRMVATL